jgi:hypothetical protein
MRLPLRHLSIGLSLATGALLALAGCEVVSVTVIDAASVEISPNDVTVFEGQEEEVSAIVRSSAGDILTGRNIQWTIDEPDVAVVSETGVVRGAKSGTTTLRVRTGAVEGTAPVTVLARPEIGLSRSDVAFQGVSGGEDPPDEEVEVVDAGGGMLSGLSLAVETEGGDAGWLSASLGSSEAPTTLTISASIGSRPVGIYEGTVLVSAPEAHNSPQEVHVTLEVKEPPPIILVTPLSVLFSSVARSHEPATQGLMVRNAGGGILSGLSTTIEYVSGSGGWLSAELGSSIAPTDLELVASARELTAGTYLAEVEVSSLLIPGESRTVTVEFQVSPGRGPRR